MQAFDATHGPETIAPNPPRNQREAGNKHLIYGVEVI